MPKLLAHQHRVQKTKLAMRQRRIPSGEARKEIIASARAFDERYAEALRSAVALSRELQPGAPLPLRRLVSSDAVRGAHGAAALVPEHSGTHLRRTMPSAAVGVSCTVPLQNLLLKLMPRSAKMMQSRAGASCGWRTPWMSGWPTERVGEVEALER